MAITIQIGNTDNKLTQQDWSKFVKETRNLIIQCAEIAYFDGGSISDAPWQNHCFVFDMKTDFDPNYFIKTMKEISRRYNQESVAYNSSETEFI